MMGFSLSPWFPVIYSEYAPYTCVEDMKDFIDQLNQLIRVA